MLEKFKDFKQRETATTIEDYEINLSALIRKVNELVDEVNSIPRISTDIEPPQATLGVAGTCGQDPDFIPRGNF